MTQTTKILSIAAAEHTLHRTTIEKCVAALEIWKATSPRSPAWEVDGMAHKALFNAKRILEQKKFDCDTQAH